MLSRFFGLLFCFVGLLLPHRARIWFSEFLGWATQGVYYLYYGLMNYLLNELRQAEMTADGGQKDTQETERDATGTVSSEPLADEAIRP